MRFLEYKSSELYMYYTKKLWLPVFLPTPPIGSNSLSYLHDKIFVRIMRIRTLIVKTLSCTTTISLGAGDTFLSSKHIFKVSSCSNILFRGQFTKYLVNNIVGIAIKFSLNEIFLFDDGASKFLTVYKEVITYITTSTATNDSFKGMFRSRIQRWSNHFL